MSKVNLFEIYAENLRLVKQHPLVRMEPDASNVVMCPICFDKYFFPSSIDEKILTIEHVPPKTLGGKPKTLTCYECNQQYAEFDEALRRRVSAKPFMDSRPGASLDKVKVTIKDGPSFWGRFELPAKNDPDGAFLLTVDQKLSPAHFDQIVKATQQPDGFEGITSYEMPKHERENVNLVRIAYLLLFSAFGYGLIVHPNYEPIREQLRHPKTEILPNYGLIEATGLPFPDTSLGINLITKPRAVQSFLIVFDLKPRNGQPVRRAVVMPGPGNPTFNEIKTWLIDNPEFNSPTITLEHITENSSHMMKLKEPFVAHAFWHNLMIAGNSTSVP